MRSTLIPNSLLWILLLAIQVSLPLNEVWDDAYITLIYSQNLAHGNGLVYAPFDQGLREDQTPVEGFSNPLWMLIHAVFCFLPGSVLMWSRLALLTAFGSLLSIIWGLTYHWLKDTGVREGITRSISMVPALSLLGLFSLHIYVKNGMETILFVALLYGALLHTLRILVMGFNVRITDTVSNALLWSCVALSRPEAPAYLLIPLFLGGTHRARLTLRVLALWGLFILLTCGGYLVFRLFYYGELLPNTYYAKVDQLYNLESLTHREVWLRGLKYVLETFRTESSLFVVFTAVAGLWYWQRYSRAPYFIVWFVVLINLAITIHVGGDFWPYGRFLLPALVGLVWLATVPVLQALITASRLRRRRWQVFSTLAIVALFVSLDGWTRISYWSTTGASQIAWIDRLKQAFTATYDTPHARVGTWLRKSFPPGTVIATGQAGQIPYFSQLETVDLLGLNDHYLARNSIDLEYLKARGVDVLVLQLLEEEGLERRTLFEALLGSPGFPAVYPHVAEVEPDCAYAHIRQWIGNIRFLILVKETIEIPESLRAGRYFLADPASLPL